MSEETVCAVLVTFNRKELLIECLESLKNQSRPLDAIYVIDNASTDGTINLLLKKKYINSIPPTDILEPYEAIYKGNKIPIHYIRMHKNIGGAGGFHEGLKRAYSAGYDWFWLMDDDGTPSHECLEKLLVNKQFFMAPIIINNKNHEKLSFPSYIFRNGKKLELITVDDAYKASEDKKTIPNFASPFNGTLISKVLVEKIGYPRKEFFIWGDESEYLKRSQLYGFNAVTFLDAHFFHPPNQIKIKSPLKGLIGHSYFADDLKLYCFYRNNYHIIRDYDGYISLLYVICTEIARRIILNDLKGLKIVLSAWSDSFLNKWGKERKFIK